MHLRYRAAAYQGSSVRLEEVGRASAVGLLAFRCVLGPGRREVYIHFPAGINIRVVLLSTPQAHSPAIPTEAGYPY